MAISPQLALGVRTPELPSRLDIAAKGQQLDIQRQQADEQRVAADQQAQLRTQQIADNQFKLAGQQRDQAAHVATAAAVSKRKGADGAIDWQGVSQDLSGLGFTDQAAKVLDAATANQSHLEALSGSRLKVQQATAEAAARMALSIDWSDADNIAAHVHVAAANGLLEPQLADQLLAKASDIAKDPAIGQQITERMLAGAPEVQKEITERRTKEAGIAKTEAETEQLRSGANVNWQRENVLLDGQPTVIQTNPRSGQSRDLSGRPIENAASRVKPMPTAQTAAAAPSGPTTDVDLAPPSGPNANRAEPATGLSPTAIHQNALAFVLEGKTPSLGMGANPQTRAARNAILNRGSALAAAAGSDIPTLQAEYKANSAALNKLVPMVRATTTFSNTALDNMKLAEAQSAKVARTGSPLANKYLQWARGESLTGDPELTRFQTYIYTAAREYAKVTSGGALSAAALSDSAAKEAEKLLNAAQTPAAFNAALGAMQDDMANVIRRQNETVQKVSPAVANFLAVAAGQPPLPPPASTDTPAAASSGPKKIGRFEIVTGP